MKIIPISACITIALLGSSACGKSGNEVRAVGGAGSLPASSAGSGTDGASGRAGGGGGEAGLDTAPASAGSGDHGGSASATEEAGTGGGGASSVASFKQCMPGDTTTISGVVLDPAGTNPLYNVMVYVIEPSSQLPDLDGVPIGCGCAQLLPTKVLAKSAPTDVSGHFEIPCAPSGTVSLVVQTGKWRRRYDDVKVALNEQNVVPNLRLPANSSEGSLPNIAISTGGADSFECLPLRIGISASEYVAGSASGGHIHIYTGTRGATPAQGAVQSFKTLWDSQAHLNEHDVVILSCEGEPATGGSPDATLDKPIDSTAQQYLMNYANAGGRVLAEHYHYVWFNTGPFATGANNLATWTSGSQIVDDTQAFPAEIDTTLSNGAAFPEGAAFAQWLANISALSNNQLPVWFARANVQALVEPPSTEWIHLADSVINARSAPQLFSADMPVGATGSSVCGRVAYTTLHTGTLGNAVIPGVPVDYPPASGGSGGGGAGGVGGSTGFPGPMPGGPSQGGIVPSGCALHPLTPQEAALEFMFFDLSSCLLPIGEEPREP